MIKDLGPDGMSSDESEIDEHTGREILHVSQMTWRRKVDREMDLVDRQRMTDMELFSKKGAKPATRVRDGKETRRNPVEGLSKAFYEKTWLAAKSEAFLKKFSIAKKQVKWLALWKQ